MSFDGQAIVAARGEPVAVSLLAAGHLVLARSPKFHRPRGPSCLRGACDGCLARVDGMPNVMTCRVPAAEGTRVETQNVVGSRERDLLRMADWFFPEGMNHHELFAGVPGVQTAMQRFARRVAGLGKLPAGPSPTSRPSSGEAGDVASKFRPRSGKAGDVPSGQKAARRRVDALVVGSGPAGMAVALALAAAGRKVEVVEEDLAWGGSLLALGAGVVPPEWRALVTSFRDAVAGGHVVVRTRTLAAGLYGEDVVDVLVVGDAGVEVVTADTLALATGAHDGVLAFEGNDLPGVLSARAAGRLASLGLSVGDAVVVAVAPGGGPFGEAFARAHRGVTLLHGTPVRAVGSSRIREAIVATPRGDHQLRCDALVIDAARAPAYELAAQTGAEVVRAAAGYVVATSGGRIRPGVFALGEVAGTPLEPEAIREAAEAVARAA